MLFGDVDGNGEGVCDRARLEPDALGLLAKGGEENVRVVEHAQRAFLADHAARRANVALGVKPYRHFDDVGLGLGFGFFGDQRHLRVEYRLRHFRNQCAGHVY